MADTASTSCDVHKYLKKGTCQYCGICRYCDPLDSCENPSTHIKGRTNRQSNATTPSNNTKKRRGTRLSSGRGKNRTKIIDDNDINLNRADEDGLISAIVSNKEKMSQICDILNVDKAILQDLLHDRFTKKSMSTERGYQ